MRKLGDHAGYAVKTGPKGTWEADTQTCRHCSTVYATSTTDGKPDLGGWCRVCSSPVCGKCADLGVCDPFEKKLERWGAAERIAGAVDRQVARARLFREMGI